MGLYKGQTNNPNGRLKCTLSRKTVLWNELGDFFINEGAERFITEIKSLNGKDYIHAYRQLIEFLKPKQSRVATTDDLDSEIESLTDEQAETFLKQLSDKVLDQWAQKMN